MVYLHSHYVYHTHFNSPIFYLYPEYYTHIIILQWVRFSGCGINGTLLFCHFLFLSLHALAEGELKKVKNRVEESGCG